MLYITVEKGQDVWYNSNAFLLVYYNSYPNALQVFFEKFTCLKQGKEIAKNRLFLMKSKSPLYEGSLCFI